MSKESDIATALVREALDRHMSPRIGDVAAEKRVDVVADILREALGPAIVEIDAMLRALTEPRH